MTREPESQERCVDGEPHCWHDDGHGMEECCGECGLRRGAGSALHNARLAPQPLVPEPRYDDVYRDAMKAVSAPQDAGAAPLQDHHHTCDKPTGGPCSCYADKVHALTTRLRQAAEINYAQADMLIEANKRTDASEARVTALEAALASQNYIQWADDRVPGSQETR